MEYYPFDSRNTLYRNKIGALAEGETLRLKLLIHKDACVHRAFILIKNDNENDVKSIDMVAGEYLEDYRFYECDISLNEGLYWYSFYYTSDYGVFHVTKTETSLGIVSNTGGWWQQTVYCRDYVTPHWLDGGIIYQIFPDRFYNSGKEKENIPKDRFICDNWSKEPEYRQWDNKCSLGNDYYGGDLKGIEKKLDYLVDLGVTCIYLNPIFEAHSNHRYNTADYFKIDAHLGDEKDLKSLIKSAKKRGISIILDGVFSHTGDDSIYFNRYKRYKNEGAYNSKNSPYYSWYNFKNFPDDYAAWWGVPSLPETNETDPSFNDFITGKKGVIRHWLKKGIKGWRLDVADELPDSFLDNIRIAVKAEGNDNFLLGEVWEDATNKISYDIRRRFLRGKQLDSVMNYPFSEAIINFVKGGVASDLVNTVMDILENYPPQAVRLLMNHIGTHDTPRILTRLGSENQKVEGRENQAGHSLNEREYAHGISLLKLAAVLQFTLPGVPSIFYGDEAGVTGWGDPFCRASYPWGKENKDLVGFYKKLGTFRKNNPVFAKGEFIPVTVDLGHIAYMRKTQDAAVLIAVNRWCEEAEIDLPKEFNNAKPVFEHTVQNGKLKLNKEDFEILVL